MQLIKNKHTDNRLAVFPSIINVQLVNLVKAYV